MCDFSKIVRQSIADLKYGILLGFAGFILTLVGTYYATGMLDPRFPAVIGAGFFGGGFFGSLMRRLYKSDEGRKADFIFFIFVLLFVLPCLVEQTGIE